VLLSPSDKRHFTAGFSAPSGPPARRGAQRARQQRIRVGFTTRGRNDESALGGLTSLRSSVDVPQVFSHGGRKIPVGLGIALLGIQDQ
jgi:hypothetical protein